MEEYANENGREMVLNKYADCTEEEYRALTETKAPLPELVVEKVEAIVEEKKEETVVEVVEEVTVVVEKEEKKVEPKKQEVKGKH
jgi:hypothetical protein